MEVIIAATGHRPDKLGGFDQKTRLALGRLATEYLSREQPDEAISGMADGWDMAVAGACVALGIPFTAAVPFEGQEKRWSEDTQQRYRLLLSQAKEVVIVSDFPSTKAFQTRNEWMVDRAAKMVALWDGSFGGTHNCIVYARKKHVPFDNLWDRWTLPADVRWLMA